MTEIARVDIERHDHRLIAHLRGEVDASNVRSLQRDIVAAIPNTAAGLVLELSALDYIDSSGIRMLFALHKQLERRGQRVRAVVPDATPVKRVLDFAGVGTLIPLDAELSAALAELV